MTNEQRDEQGTFGSKLCEEYPMEEKLFFSFFSANWQEIWLLVAEMREDILFIVHAGYNLYTHTSLAHISPNKTK